ncbi:hypothetical protein AD998_21675 [bacterium 336/3]|nr:hypothetical protein AD998_21675 [bacterium 336/3]
MAIMMTIYNMKRVLNILGTEKFLEKLKIWKPKYPRLAKSNKKRMIVRQSTPFIFCTYKLVA